MKMGKLILLNDVHTEMSGNDFLVSGVDVPADKLGETQSIKIAAHITSKINIDHILASDALCLMKLLHCIRINSKNTFDRSIVYTDALRERDFGVLSGTKYSLKSEIFTHSRICPEGGESVNQCQERAMRAVRTFCEKHQGNNLIVSHPFTCQIITNVLSNRSLTWLSDFWLRKGAYLICDGDARHSGNALEN